MSIIHTLNTQLYMQYNIKYDTYIYIHIYILTLSAFYIKREIYITNSRRHIFETVIYTHTHTHIYIYMYIYTYIYIYLLQSRYKYNVRFFKKNIEKHIFLLSRYFATISVASSVLLLYIYIYVYIYIYIHTYIYICIQSKGQTIITPDYY